MYQNETIGRLRGEEYATVAQRGSWNVLSKFSLWNQTFRWNRLDSGKAVISSFTQTFFV